jgi:hypothetical protein
MIINGKRNRADLMLVPPETDYRLGRNSYDFINLSACCQSGLHRRRGPQRLRTSTPSAGRAERDATLKERDLETWRLLHQNDASEIERRRLENTAVMYRMLGRQSPLDS